MQADTVPRRAAGRMPGWIAVWSIALLLARPEAGRAFPLLDTGNTTDGPVAADLAAPDAQDLKHQLQIANGLQGLAAGGGWTFQPRVSFQEALTDNVLQTSSPRRWDLTTYLSPGMTLVGNTERAQVSLDYAPVLIMNARTGSQNALNQQLNGTATITAIEEFAFLDLRAVSGVQSARGALGGGGTIGAGNIGGLTAGAGSGGIGQTGLTRQNELQTSSIAISPYVVRKFGDYGTLRVGYSLNIGQSSPVNGFQYLPIPSGSGSQSLISNEQTVNFKTGDFLDDFQDTFNLDFTQSMSRFQSGTLTTGSTSAITSTRSTREIVTNQVSYAVNRWATLNVSVGHEHIVYTGAGLTPIDDLTWNIGTTLTPNPDSAITIGYGHQQGTNSLTFDGHYQLTARTSISASYNESLGTQLENLRNQLGAGAIGVNGGTVNATTGGQQFTGTNNTPTQAGIFRFQTFTASVNTRRDRDTLTLTLNSATSTSTGGITAAQSSTRSSGVVVTWIHEMAPDLTLNTSASYYTLTSGSSMAFNAALQYIITDSLSASMRYTFFKSTSSTPLLNLYEDILLLGITKQF
jgi:uncharacterized protein (PEP-CTERM system associated)